MTHTPPTRYVVGYNMPGYMPDSEPYECDTFEEAKSCLIDELKSAEDIAIDEEEVGEFCHAAEEVNRWSSPDSIYVGNYVYWIEEV